MPGIEEAKCDICGDELSMENYYYISAGRLQQGVMSDPRSYTEYKLCTNCYTMIKAELIASVQKQKNRRNDK